MSFGGELGRGVFDNAAGRNRSVSRPRIPGAVLRSAPGALRNQLTELHQRATIARKAASQPILIIQNRMPTTAQNVSKLITLSASVPRAIEIGLLCFILEVCSAPEQSSVTPVTAVASSNFRSDWEVARFPPGQ